jgi:hybrid cluster-associated redox disulfide protein
MPHQTKIRLDTPIDEVMRKCPATIRVILEMNMKCVGCELACFHTVDYAAREHHKDAEVFLKALHAASL